MIFPPDEEIRQYAAYYIRAIGNLNNGGEGAENQSSKISGSPSLSKLLDNEHVAVISNLDLFTMAEVELFHEGLGDVEPALAVSTDVNSPHVLDFHRKRKMSCLIRLANSVQSRKDYIPRCPYGFVRVESWRTAK